MAFLCTFSGMLAAGVIWIAIFVELGDATSPALNSAAVWLSPTNPGGWGFFVLLSAACSWLVYRLLRPRLGDDASSDRDR
jgi:hypothetical protein